MTTVDEELEQLKAAIHLQMDDEQFIALLDELDRTSDRLGLLKDTLARLNDQNASKHTDMLTRHGLSVEQEKGTRTYWDDNKQATVTTEVLRGWSVIKNAKGVSLRCGKTGAWVPYHHQVTSPYTSKSDAERGALIYADMLEREAQNHSVPIKQVVLRIPVATEYPKPDKKMNVNIELDTECRAALTSLLWGLKTANVEMSNGHRVDTLTHAIRWVFEELHKKI